MTEYSVARHQNFCTSLNYPCDGIKGNPSINFNAGDHAVSIQMSHADYVAVEKPEMLAIS